MVYFLIIIGIFALDRFVKYLVSSGMYVGESIPIIDQIFHITYIRNQGAAFSLLEGQKWILIGLPIVVMVVGIMLLLVERKVWHPMLNTSIAFICAGGIGNLIDRAFLGYVVDMFDFRVFPVFNIADIFVCIGCGLLLLYVLVFDRNKDEN